MSLLSIRMADQDWYAGDVYDDNQYDDDQQQQRQQQPADATAPPAAPAHTSTQPYTRGAIAPRGRDTSSRPDAVGGGGRNVGRTAPAPSRDVIRGGGQSQSGRERVIQREPYHNGNWPHWDGKETARDYKDVPPRDLPRDGFREEPSALFATPLIFVMLEVGRAFEMSLFLATVYSEMTLETFTVAETTGQIHKTSVIHLLQVTVRQLLVLEAMQETTAPLVQEVKPENTAATVTSLLPNLSTFEMQGIPITTATNLLPEIMATQ